MIILELAFRDTAERLAARPAHRTILHRLHADGVLVAAGPWADDSGAALIFDADRPRVEEILAGDPYYATEGVRVVAMRDWAPVVGP